MHDSWETPASSRRPAAVAIAALVLVAGALLARGGTADVPPGELQVVRPPTPAPIAEPVGTEGWVHVADPTGGFQRPADRAVAGGALAVWLSGGDLPAAGWRLDAERGWESIAPAPFPAAGGRSSTWTGDRLVVWGGAREGRAVREGALWDPATDRWRKLSPAPLVGRADHGATWGDGRLFLWGGLASEPTLSVRADGAAWDARSDTWTVLPPGPLPARVRPLLAWTGAELLVWGGQAGGRNLHDGALLDPRAGTWRPMTPIPVRYREDPAAVWHQGRLVVWGRPVARHRPPGWAYDPAADEWTMLPRLLLQERGGAHAISAEDTIIVWGGRDEEGRRQDGFLLDLGSNAWRRVPPAPTGHRRRPLVAWTDAGLIVWGGSAWGRPVADGWLHTVAARPGAIPG
jgi:hypothetical protein